MVTYWFEKARGQIEAGKIKRVGLVATNSIRGGANRKVLDRVIDTGHIFNAWSDEPWINNGAAVRVSLVCFGSTDMMPILNGHPVTAIYADLTGSASDSIGNYDLTCARPLAENLGIAFQGILQVGPFDIPGTLARQWLIAPNCHGKPNSDVLKPGWNGLDIVRRNRDMWIIDFGVEMLEQDAALYEMPYQYSQINIKPLRIRDGVALANNKWWIHQAPRPGMRAALSNIPRYITTPLVAKHLIFAFASCAILPYSATPAIARSDYTTFGILQSRLHKIWALRMGSSLEDRPRYTPTTTFQTYPFPPNVLHHFDTDSQYPAIAQAAKRLNELRENWLNPPEWVDRIPEIVPGYPDRIIAKPGHAADLKQRTLTNLYNQRPAWLANVHKTLDQAVAAAYGWTDYTDTMPDEEILRRLLALNLST